MNTASHKSCPSRLELAAHEAGGTLAQLAPYTKDCDVCQTRLAELAEARGELLGDDPVHTSTVAARVILARAEEALAVRRRRWTIWLSSAVLPALCTLVLFVVQKSAQRGTALHGNEPARTTLGDEGVRTKSSVAERDRLALRVYCKRGEVQFEVHEGADLVGGDRLRFVYSKSRPGFLTVFSVDDGGRIAPFYRDDSLGSQAVEAGQNVALPDSIELDSHRGWERLFALWSTAPLQAESIREAVVRGRAQSAGDIRRLTVLDLDADQVTYLVRRP